jgi:hypothetical protein
MTVLRRAPREVYRVYGEQEFLDGVDHAEAPLRRSQAGYCRRATRPPAGSWTGERRLRRVTGAALLLGAVGAVGALSAFSGAPSTKGRGRGLGGSLRASIGPLAGTHVRRAGQVSQARIWRPRAARRSSGERSRAARPARIDQRAGRRGRALVAGAPLPSVERAVEPPKVNGTSVSVARLTATAGASVGPQGPVHPEFGFER